MATLQTGDAAGPQYITTVVARFVKQLLEGCDHNACTETLCFTGHRNVAKKPLRRYTPRSARAMAIMMAGSADLRARLCPHLGDHWKLTEDIKPGPQDPSSVVQQLADTTAVQEFCLRERQPSVTTHQRNYQAEYSKAWHSLDPLFEPLPTGEAPLGFKLLSNAKAANLITQNLRWLLDGILARASGRPPAHAQSECLLDGFPHIPEFGFVGFSEDHCMRFVARIAQATASRLVLETAVRSAHSSDDAEDLEGPPSPYYLSIVELVAKALIRASTGEEQGDMQSRLGATDLQQWQILLSAVVRDDLRHSGEKSHRIILGSMASGALHLLAAIARYSKHPVPEAYQKHKLSWVSSASDVEIARSFTDFLDRQDPFETHILAFPELWTANESYVYWRTICHRRMAAIVAKANLATSMLQDLSLHRDYFQETGVYDGRAQYLETCFLLINVSRTDVLKDTLDQLWHRREEELMKPLRVRLGEIDLIEVGQDLGGVQIEFFNLVCKAVMSEEAGLFTSDASTGLSWFKPCSLQPLHIFELFGLLVGLAVYNGIAIPVSLPRVFYDYILDRWHPAEDTLDDHWPAESRSLRSLLASDGQGLDFGMPLEANGLRLHVQDCVLHDDGHAQMQVDSINTIRHGQTEGAGIDTAQNPNPDPLPESDRVFQLGWPGWTVQLATASPEPLDQENIAKFVCDYRRWLVRGSVWPQLAAFQRGFDRMVPSRTRSLFTPSALRSLVEGRPELDVTALEKATRYDGYRPTDAYIQMFWSVVRTWARDEVRQLVKFVTAMERIPAGGAGSIRFEIKRTELVYSEALPTSSTCFGALYLPEYKTREILDRKLRIAVMYGVEGFGMG